MSEKQILHEIKKLQRDIKAKRDELLGLYNVDKLHSVMPHYKRRKTLPKQNVPDIYNINTLKACFYETFMKIIIKKDGGIVLAFPTKEDEKYGIQIKQNEDTCAITHYTLPGTIQPERFILNVENIPINDISYDVAKVYRSIMTFINRKEQVLQLQNMPGRIGTLSVSTNYKLIRIAISIQKKDGSETMATAILKYNDMNICPYNVQLYFDDSSILSQKQQTNFLERCKMFLQDNLVQGYEVFLGME